MLVIERTFPLLKPQDFNFRSVELITSAERKYCCVIIFPATNRMLFSSRDYSRPYFFSTYYKLTAYPYSLKNIEVKWEIDQFLSLITAISSICCLYKCTITKDWLQYASSIAISKARAWGKETRELSERTSIIFVIFYLMVVRTLLKEKLRYFIFLYFFVDNT